MPREGGPVGVMLFEHDQGRSFVRKMTEATEAYGSDPKTAGMKWAEAAQNYASLLRAHIDKENHVLFVMAERMLSQQEQELLAKQFETLEMEKMGKGTHERLHAMMDKLLAELASAQGAHAGAA